MTDQILAGIAAAEERLNLEAAGIEWEGLPGDFQKLNNMISDLARRIEEATGSPLLGFDPITEESLHIELPMPVIDADVENRDPFTRARKFDPAKNAEYLTAHRGFIELFRERAAA